MYVYVHIRPTVCRLILFESVQNFIKVYSRKLRTLNCDSYEPTKVLVSNAVVYTCFNKLHIHSSKIFQLKLFPGRTRIIFKSLNVSGKIPV